MSNENLIVKEIERKDIASIINYWTTASADYLQSMGADINKIPVKAELEKMLVAQIQAPMKEKKSYCIIWLADDKPIGHSNVNKIIFGEEAYMHLHLWNSEYRKKGRGQALVKLTLPYFFENLKLKKIYCEPYSLNPSPNRTLEKVGFKFVKQYVTIPGSLNFEQQVNLWEMTKENFEEK